MVSAPPVSAIVIADPLVTVLVSVSPGSVKISIGPLLLTEELLTEPLDYSEFCLTVPEAPGLGITLDEAKVQAFRRDKPATKTVSTAGAR